MPIYEYICPQCGKFEELRAMDKSDDGTRCPHCNSKSERVFSRFSWKWFNPFTKDGEGFTSKFMRHEEVAEMNQECRER